MSSSVLNAPHFRDEVAAYAFIEGKLWPHGSDAYARIVC